MEQRKTLKISRPSGGMVRPTGKFGVKHPVAAQVAESAPAGDTIADIPDVPTMSVMPMGNVAAQVEGPAWWWTVLVLVQFIALVAMGALAYFLFQNTTTQYF